MSVWAQSWAYEQRLGKWRETKGGKKSWKGDPGAKSVLAAVATFADEMGYAYCGQGTLAEMTDMTERSVREHLHNLEHAYGKIRREHRRKGQGRGRGEFTSDGIWLLAPAHRLRPPRRGDAPPVEEPAEEFSGTSGRLFRGTISRTARGSARYSRRGLASSSAPGRHLRPHGRGALAHARGAARRHRTRSARALRQGANRAGRRHAQADAPLGDPLLHAPQREPQDPAFS